MLNGVTCTVSIPDGFLKQRRNNRFCENGVKLTGRERQIDSVNDCRNKKRCTFFSKPGGNRI